MRTFYRRFIPTLALALGLALPVAVRGQTITVLHVNDTHSHVDSFGPKDAHLDGTIGGLVRAATVIATQKAIEPDALLLHAGDAFHGDFFFNAYFDVPEFKILQQLGVDAMAVGNHEFDLTPAALVGALSNVGDFPMTSANLDFSQCPYPPTPAQPCALLPNWIKPGIVKDVEGLKVGIFGMTTPTDPTMQPKPVIVSNDLVGSATAAIAGLKAAGAQVIILLSHLGLNADRPLVAAVPGIDVVIEGHDHFLYDAPLLLDGPAGAKVPAVQAGANYLHVGKLRLHYDGAKVTVEDWEVIPVDETVPPAPTLQPLVEQLKLGIVAQYGDVYHTVFGHAPWDLSKEFDPKSPLRDTPMGNLITDALRFRTGTQIALTATGLISEGIYHGPIVGADVFRPVSYGYDPATGLGFKVATFDITGAELLKGMEICLANVTNQDTFNLQFSGLIYAYDSTRPPLQRVVPGSVYVRGRPLKPEQTYSATVNEGVALLLPSMGVTVTNLQILQDFEYKALLDYIARLEWLPYTAQGRIRDVSVRLCRR